MVIVKGRTGFSDKHLGTNCWRFCLDFPISFYKSKQSRGAMNRGLEVWVSLDFRNSFDKLRQSRVTNEITYMAKS